MDEKERSVILAMLKHLEVSGCTGVPEFTSECVFDLDDGGMGSIEFYYPEKRHKYLGDVVSCEAVDEDQILLVLTLGVSDLRTLYELDIWKVDFSPLKRFPNPSDLMNFRICKDA